MGIVFFCQSCGARFEVDSRMAGKRGRCKKCGQMMSIPKAESLASMMAMPALVGAGAGAGAGVVREIHPASEAPGVEKWLGGAASNVGLAPLTVDQIRSPFGKQQTAKRKAADDDLGDGLPYAVEQFDKGDKRGRATKPVSGVKMAYRKELNSVLKILRMINEAAYLVSVPFLMILLLGILTRSHSMEVFGATVVVLLNIGRVVTGIVNLAVVPFRESPLQGILFLIPPFTFIYLSQHWNKLKKPAMRVVGPLLTILAVVAAFSFIPSISGKTKATGSVVDRLKAGASTLKSDIKGQIKEAESLDLQSLQQKAEAGLKSIGDRAKAQSKGDGDPAPEAAEPKSDDAPRGFLRNVEKKINDALDSTGGKSIDKP